MKIAATLPKEDKWFETFHLKDGLKSHSIKGGFSTVGGQAVSFLMTLGSTVIMARLLTPQDYGLVAMVTAITGFVAIFKDLGLSAAIIQKDSINQQQVSAVFWVNVLVSLGIALIIAALAPVLVYFYEEPRLLLITLAFSVSIFIAGLSVQHSALMRRQMRFQQITLIHLGSSSAGVLAGILLAWTGFGYWGIVATTALPPFFSTLALWILCDWRPSFSMKASELNYFLKFGAGITGFDMVNYFSRNLDNVIIGKYAGSAALGIYTRAYQLLMLPITQLRNPLNAVALPVLSTLQNNREQYRQFYSRYLFTLAFFSMPIVIYLGVFSDKIILILMGEKWIGASYIFQILAIVAFMQPVISTQGLILMTMGKVKKYFITGVINAIFTVAGFLIGIRWGVEGVALSQPIVLYALFIPTLLYSTQGTHISPGLFLKEIAYPALFSLASGLVMYLFRKQAGLYFASDFLLCIGGFMAGALFYGLLWFSTGGTRTKIRQVLDMVSSLKQKRRK